MASMNISKPNISALAFRLVLLGAAAVAAPLPAHAQAQPAVSETASKTLERFVGRWDGELEYRNSLTGAIATVPTTMVGKMQGDRALLDVVADDGKGRIVRQPFTISIQPHRQTMTRNPGDRPLSFAATGDLTPKPSEPLKLELLARGSEGGGPVDIRETLSIEGDKLVWRRETQPDGRPFAFKSEYRLTRKP